MAKPYKSVSKLVANPVNAGTSKAASSIKKQPKTVVSKNIVSGKRAKAPNVTIGSGRPGGYKPNKPAKIS